MCLLCKVVQTSRRALEMELAGRGLGALAADHVQPHLIPSFTFSIPNFLPPFTLHGVIQAASLQ